MPAATVAAINQGIEPGISITEAQAVRSDDFESVHFISGKLTGPGVDGAIGTWASNRLGRDPGGVILSVDAIAKEFSDFPDGAATEANLTLGDDGVSESRDCV